MCILCVLNDLICYFVTICFFAFTRLISISRIVFMTVSKLIHLFSWVTITSVLYDPILLPSIVRSVWTLYAMCGYRLDKNNFLCSVDFYSKCVHQWSFLSILASSIIFLGLIHSTRQGVMWFQYLFHYN